MKSPMLNRQLTLESPVRTPDGAGGYAVTWTALGTLWAAIKPGNGRERGGAAVTLSQVPLRIVVRAAPVGSSTRPKPDQRFREGLRSYTILAVSEDDPAGRFLTCHAIEEVAA